MMKNIALFTLALWSLWWSRLRLLFMSPRRVTPQPDADRLSWFWPTETPLSQSQKFSPWSFLKRFTRRPIETKNAVPKWRWPDFTPREMACRHCEENYLWPDFMDALQAARDQVGRPFHILSAHRCGLHNARIGGAALSQHLRLAVDIRLKGHDPTALHQALIDAGFTGFGFYTTFIHADMGRPQHWYGNQKAEIQWQQV